MKVESIIKRDPPTEITLGDTAYQFEVDAEGRHVCEVEDQAHLGRLLSITEGYRLLVEDGQLAPVFTPPAPVVTGAPTLQPVADPNADTLLGSSVHPASFEIDGETLSLGDVVAVAFELSAMTTAEWNALPDEERHNLIDAALDALDQDDTTDETGGDTGASGESTTETTDTDTATVTPPAQPTAEEQAKAERDELAQQYKAKFGSLPHYKWTAEKIRAALEGNA